jgi:hypothetical protein
MIVVAWICTLLAHTLGIVAVMDFPPDRSSLSWPNTFLTAVIIGASSLLIVFGLVASGSIVMILIVGAYVPIVIFVTDSVVKEPVTQMIRFLADPRREPPIPVAQVNR